MAALVLGCPGLGEQEQWPHPYLTSSQYKATDAHMLTPFPPMDTHNIASSKTVILEMKVKYNKGM